MPRDSRYCFSIFSVARSYTSQRGLPFGSRRSASPDRQRNRITWFGGTVRWAQPFESEPPFGFTVREPVGVGRPAVHGLFPRSHDESSGSQ